ncbi:CynX/NimT family MFS transporter [Chloroflexota bacterium]
MPQDISSRTLWIILGSACLLGFAIYAPMYCVPPMEHILREKLSLTYTQVSLLYTGPILAAVAVSIPAGLFADRIGVRKAAGIGIIVVVIGTMLRGTATDPTSLLFYTFVYGIGLGWTFPNLPKLVSTWIPAEKTGMATGIYTSGIIAGGALALGVTNSLVFPITNTFQGVFFIWSIIPLVVAILWWTLVIEPPHDIGHVKTTSVNTALFSQVLRNRNIWLVSVLFFLHNFFFISWFGWTPALMSTKGATSGLAGLITSVTQWVSIPSVLLMPRLSDKLGLRKPFLWVSSIMLAFLTWWTIEASLSMSWLLVALVGITNSTRFVTILALPVEMVPKEEVGTATGLVLLGNIGGVIGPLIIGSILDLTGRLDLSFLLLVGVSIVTAGITFMLPETGQKQITGSGESPG